MNQAGMKIISIIGIVAVLCLISSALNVDKYFGTSYAASGSECTPPKNTPLPDLKVAVPQHLQMIKQNGHYFLRLTNGIANTGNGVWQMVPVNPPTPDQKQRAEQQFLDAGGNIVFKCLTDSSSMYHPAHKHFHISDVAEFSVHLKSPKSEDIIGTSGKVTSCLIDWVRLVGNSPDNERVYSSCDSGVQGISPGWVDQYHMALEGQSVPITKAVDISKSQPETTFYLTSEANPKNSFTEKTLENNIAWVSFKLHSDSTGNPKIEITGQIDCSRGLCVDSEDFPNR